MIVTALMVNWDTEVPTNTKASLFQVTWPALARLARETEAWRWEMACPSRTAPLMD